MIDLSQDQDHSAGPSSPAAEGSLTSDQKPSQGDIPGAVPAFKPGEAGAEQQKQSTGKKRSGRPPRGRQEALQDKSAAGNADSEAQQSTKKIQRHSKSGVEVEMEEI